MNYSTCDKSGHLDYKWQHSLGCLAEMLAMGIRDENKSALVTDAAVTLVVISSSLNVEVPHDLRRLGSFHVGNF